MECLDFASSLFLCSDDILAQIVSTVKWRVLIIYELFVNFSSKQKSPFMGIPECRQSQKIGLLLVDNKILFFLMFINI